MILGKSVIIETFKDAKELLAMRKPLGLKGAGILRNAFESVLSKQVIRIKK